MYEYLYSYLSTRTQVLSLSMAIHHVCVHVHMWDCWTMCSYGNLKFQVSPGVHDRLPNSTGVPFSSPTKPGSYPSSGTSLCDPSICIQTLCPATPCREQNEPVHNTPEPCKSHRGAVFKEPRLGSSFLFRWAAIYIFICNTVKLIWFCLYFILSSPRASW